MSGVPRLGESLFPPCPHVQIAGAVSCFPSGFLRRTADILRGGVDDLGTTGFRRPIALCMPLPSSFVLVVRR